MMLAAITDRSGLGSARSRCGLYKLGNAGWRMSTEGSTDDFAQRLGIVDDKQPTHFGVVPALVGFRSAPA